MIAYARTASPVPFGGSHGVMCDLFFLICCRDHSTHLRTLARLGRMLLRPNIFEELREAETVGESYRILESAERDVIGG